MKRFNVVEREDVHFEVIAYAGKFSAWVEYDGFIGADGFRYHNDSFKVGGSYKTERGAISACKRYAANRNYTLVEA